MLIVDFSTILREAIEHSINTYINKDFNKFLVNILLYFIFILVFIYKRNVPTVLTGNCIAIQKHFYHIVLDFIIEIIKSLWMITIGFTKEEFNPKILLCTSDNFLTW